MLGGDDDDERMVATQKAIGDLGLAPPPDLPAPDMGADEGRDVGESSIQVQGRSERESGMKKHEGFVAPKASSWVDVAQEKKVLRKYNLEITDSDGHSNVEIPGGGNQCEPTLEGFSDREVSGYCASHCTCRRKQNLERRWKGSTC